MTVLSQKLSNTSSSSIETVRGEKARRKIRKIKIRSPKKTVPLSPSRKSKRVGRKSNKSKSLPKGTNK